MRNEFEAFDDGSGLSGRGRARRTAGLRMDETEVTGGPSRMAANRRWSDRRVGWTRLEPSSRPPPRRNRSVGWSLVIAALSITAVAALAIANGSTTIGVIACGGMVASAWGLVAAELVSRYQRSDEDADI